MTDANGKKEFCYFEKTVEWFYVKFHLKDFGAPLAGLHERAGDALVGDESKFVVIEFKKSDEEFSDECRKYPSTRYKLPYLKKRYTELLPSPDSKQFLALPSIELLSDSSARFETLIDQESSIRSSTQEDANLLDRKDLFYFPHFFIYAIPKKAEDGILKIDHIEASHYWGKWTDDRQFFNKLSQPNGNNRYDMFIDPPPPISKTLEDIKIETNLTQLAEDYGWDMTNFVEYINDVVVAKGGPVDTAKGGWMFSSVLGIRGDGTPITMTVWEFCEAFKNIKGVEHSSVLGNLCKAFSDQISVTLDDRPHPSTDTLPDPVSSTEENASQVTRGSSRRTLSYKPPGF
jgi:hypothetical protein